MNFSPEDVILVTGASSGIGRAIALECVKQGCQVIAQGRDRQRLEEARDACAFPERWHNSEFDFLENMNSIPDWIKSLVKTKGPLKGLAHSAGTGRMDILATYDPQISRAYFELNFHAPLLLARSVADRRASHKGGSMVFVGSVAGLHPEKGHLLYGAAKAALMAAAKSMSQELAPRLRVNCVAPGIVDTPMQKQAEALLGESYRSSQLANYPFGFGSPEDVARAVAFLLSDAAGWITGQNFILDGGRY